MSHSIRRIIVDIDPGIDDVYALLTFLYAEQLKKLKIEAITLSRGNTTLENVCKNIVRFLQLIGRTDIPIYMGAKEALIPPQEPLTSTHFGIDGFGDLTYSNEPDLSIIETKPAPIAMGELVMNNPGDITLVCLAPLTNVALAVKLYREFSANVREIYLMGGNYKGVGNSSSAAEFNFYLDPEAAHIVIQSATCPVTILPYETCIDTHIDISWRFDFLGLSSISYMVELLNRAERKIYSTKKIRKNIWYPCDGFLAAAIVYPEAIVRTSTHYATVELNGALTRGQMVLDHLKQKAPNVTIIEKIDQEFFMNLMLETIRNYNVTP